MGQNPDQIRRNIESTRADMGAALDEIGDRVSPGRIVERRKERIRDRVQSVRTRVMGSSEDDLYPSYSAYSGATGYPDYSGAQADSGSTLTSIKEGVQGAPQQVRQQAAGSPLVAGAIAFGAGLLAAGLMPSSKAERKAATALQEKAEPLKEQVKEVASDVGANVAEVAKDAKTTLTDQAREAAEQVRTEAQSAAGDLTEGAKGHADDVKAQAQASAAEVRDDAQSSVDSVKQSNS